MTHPDDLLADYVDGALADAERAGVDAHLATCARCRDEVALAGRARSALKEMPLAEAPAGIASRALAEAASAGKAARVGGPPRWTRLLPIAAAAVVVGLLVIALPRLGQRAGSPQVAASGGAVQQEAGDAAPSNPRPEPGSADALKKIATKGVAVEHLPLDYTDESLRDLVEETAARWRDVAFPNRTAAGFAAAPDATLWNAADGLAFDCVFEEVQRQPNAILVRVIDASYRGEPAFLAVFLEGSGAGRAADRAVVWIVLKDGCALEPRVVEIST